MLDTRPLFHRVFFLGVALAMACGGSSSPASDASRAPDGATTQFEIGPQPDAPFADFPQKILVFDLPIFAARGVESEKILHAARVLAHYLDNDQDGAVDVPELTATMKANQAFLVMWKNESDLDVDIPPGIGQDLGADETSPAWHSDRSARFDASLEEVLHLITHAGYAQLYPGVFGEAPGTDIALAMDVARGGHFKTVPQPYPDGAWYSYDDVTCDYACMVTEYHYWALTSLLGAQAERLDEIGHEWALNTSEKLRTTDAAITELLTRAEYGFPTRLPDGTYDAQ